VHSVDKEKDMMYQTTGDTGLKIDWQNPTLNLCFWNLM
jgi:hypothetical protein